MTIINLKKTRRSFISPFICAALILIVGGATLNILIYNKTVNVKHIIKQQEKIIEQARAENASVKNKLYQALDTSALQTLAREQGFIKITAPQYLAAH